ncbi:hypothetical protein T492DRAFT_1106777, partial [Pavlovales sp. CCMP2436]
LRLDLVPMPEWRLCAARDGLLANAPPMVHAMTDKRIQAQEPRIARPRISQYPFLRLWHARVFWGRRDVMRVACHVYDAIPFYESPDVLPAGTGGLLASPPVPGRPACMSRAVAVLPLLTSILSLPPAAFHDWNLYQKITVMNVPDMHVGGEPHPARGSRELAHNAAWQVANLRAALVAGHRWVDPLASSPGPSQTFRAPESSPPLRHAQSGPKDYQNGLFVTEKDFLDWVLRANISICDLGAETRSVLTKTLQWKRRHSMSGCVHTDAAVSIGSAATTAAAAARVPRALWSDPDVGGGARVGLTTVGVSFPAAADYRSTVTTTVADSSTAAGSAARLSVKRADLVTARALGCVAVQAQHASAGQEPVGTAAAVNDGGRAAGQSAKGVRRVAMLFVGQFLHHPKVRARPISGPAGLLPSRWLGAADGSVGADVGSRNPALGSGGAPSNAVRYDAFVATSTQHSELDPCDAVDASGVARMLVDEAGFAYAHVEALPYDERAFITAAQRAGLPFRDSMRWPLHPHRVLSFFSTFARAVRLAKGYEATTGVRFELVVVTRFDIVFHYVRGLVLPPALRQQLAAGDSPARSPGTASTDMDGWLQAVWEAGVVGRRRKRQAAWEDRFIIGRAASVYRLAALPTRFVGVFRQLGNQSWPEVHIALLLDAVGATNRSARQGPFFDDFVRLSGFRQNKLKYRADYIKLPPDLHAPS